MPWPDFGPAGWLIPVTLVAWGLIEAALRIRHWHRSGLLRRAALLGGHWRLARLNPDDWTFPAVIVAFAAGFILAGWAAGFSWARIGPPGHRGDWVWLLAAAGEVMAVAGIGLRVWAIVTLDQFFTFVVRIRPDHRLVDRGPYRLIRHPSYAGALLVPLGAGLAAGSWASMLLGCGLPLFAIGARIAKEEAALAGALGETYLAYAKRTSRLIPRIWLSEPGDRAGRFPVLLGAGLRRRVGFQTGSGSRTVPLGSGTGKVWSASGS
jgi:protein-S-isoprenylcysteine O-methyltransferase Ste14